MVTANPFAPPGAIVRDVDAETAFQPITFWPPRGRIGRVRLLGYGGALYFVFICVTFLLGMVAGILHTGVTWVTVVTTLAYVFFGALLLIERSHDMNWSGWMSLLAFLPFVGLIWLFKSGSPGSNRFGSPPPPNTTGAKVLAWISGGLFVLGFIGIVAAIALPAYQQYTIRAKAGTIGR